MSRRSRDRQPVSDAPQLSPSISRFTKPMRDTLLSIAAIAVLFLVLVRCIVPISPNLHFDGDPRHAVTFTDETPPAHASPLAGSASAPDSSQPAGRDKQPAADASASAAIPALSLGPAGAAWLDALALAVAGAALLAHVLCGGTIRWLDVALVSIGGIFAAIHLPGHIDNLYIGGGWIGAAALAVATLHLSQHAAARRWFVAAMLALAAPLLIDAASYVFIEHAQTLEEFKKNEDAFLKARGWANGSPEHELFVRRMTLGEPTGAFAFSNVLGSVAAMLAGLGAVWAWGLFTSGTPRKLAALPAILAAAGAATVVLTTSKGAPVALVMAMSLAVAAAWCFARSKPAMLRFLPVAGVAMLVIALTLVILRGAMGPPEDHTGERSLLFRWHYWQASARIATASADAVLLGVGPLGFGEAYPAAKNPLNPEEVRSAHSVFIDWIVLLGVGGWAWTVVAVRWFWSAGASAAATLTTAAEPDEPTNGADPQSPSHAETRSLFDVPLPDLMLALALTAALFGFEAVVKFQSLLIPERFLPWAGGMMGFLFVTAVLANPRWLPRRWMPLAIFVAEAVLLIHNQIEMSYFQPASAPLAWCVLALAAGGASRRAGSTQPARRSPLLAALPGVLLIILAILFAGAFAGPVTRQQRLLSQAADELRRDGAHRQGALRVMDLLRQASDALPSDPKPYEWRSRLALEAAGSARRFLDTNPPRHVRAQVTGEMRQLTQLSLATLAQAADRGLDTLALQRQRAMTLEHAAELLDDPRYLDEALAQWQKLILGRPYVWQDRISLADLLWRMNHREEARGHYRTAIEWSDVLYLDPARRMGDADRRHCQHRAAH